MPGRPKPTALKVIEGNPGKRPLSAEEPKPAPLVPAFCDQVDDDARQIAEELSQKLNRLNLLTEVDGDTFIAMCQTISRLRQIWQELNSKNQSLIMLKHTVDGAGNEHVEAKANPLTVMERQYMQLLRIQAADFGLSPRGRAGLVVGKDDGQDPMQSLID